MTETPARTEDPCHDERDETPREGIWPSTPLCDAAEFNQMVADEAPRLFAVVQEYGERVDGRIAAWGMTFDDNAKIVSVDDGASISLSSPERAALGFNRRPKITARVVWVNPDAATAPDEIDDGSGTPTPIRGPELPGRTEPAPTDHLGLRHVSPELD